MNLEKLESNVLASRRLIVAILILLPIGYFFWFSIIQGFALSDQTSSWGEFGDFIGGILNPLIAIFAVYWLTSSILIQKQELSETRKSLEKSQESHERQAELTLLAAKIQSLNMRMSIISSELSAKLDQRNIVLSTNRQDQLFLNEDGHQNRARVIIDKLNPEIQALRKSQTDLIMEIEKLLDET